MHRFALACLLACAVVASPGAQRAEFELRPIDQASTQPEFLVFRARLLAAIARRDVEAIVSMSDPKIRVSFGDGGGSAEWRRMLGQADAAWFSRFAETLALGGSFRSPDAFVAPYVYSAWPDRLDAFENVAVIGERVAVRAQPTTQSAVMTTLSYAVVPVADGGEKDGMTNVRLADGRKGWIATRFLRSSVNERALFNRVGGRWLLTAYVSGD